MFAPAPSAHTYDEYASSLDLWREYIDPDGTFSQEEFEAMGYEGRLSLLIKEFGPEEHEPTDAKRIARIAVLCSGPTSLEHAHEVAGVLEEIARRLRINCQIGQNGKQLILEDGRHIGSIVFEAEDAVTG